MDHQHDDVTPYARKLVSREGFLGLVTGGVVAAAGLAVSIPIIGYVFSPVIKQPKKMWRDVRVAAADGKVGEVVRRDTIALGRTQKVIYPDAGAVPWAGTTGKNASWLRRTGPEEFIAFSINCTHLGCPVEYVPGARIFLCPCHGSIFNNDGTVAGGPAARPLARYPVRVHHGRVQILTEPLPLIF